MGVFIEVNISEIEKLAMKLNSYALSNKQRENLLYDIGVEVREQTLDRFDFETDSEGNPWKKLVDATIKFKNKICNSGILERSGLLKDSLDVQVKDANSVLIGSPRHYAEYHQTGTKKLPARPFLGISTDNINDLELIIDKWVKNHVG